MQFLFVKQLSFIVARSLRTTREYAFSQVFPHVLDPPLAAHMGEPSQVQCRTFIEDDQRVRSLPGDIVPLFRPQGAGDDILTKYNAAHWSG